MPGFKDSLSADQVTELVSYLRQQFAPGKPPWDRRACHGQPGHAGDSALTENLGHGPNGGQSLRSRFNRKRRLYLQKRLSGVI